MNNTVCQQAYLHGWLKNDLKVLCNLNKNSEGQDLFESKLLTCIKTQMHLRDSIAVLIFPSTKCSFLNCQ